MGACSSESTSIDPEEEFSREVNLFWLVEGVSRERLVEASVGRVEPAVLPGSEAVEAAVAAAAAASARRVLRSLLRFLVRSSVTSLSES